MPDPDSCSIILTLILLCSLILRETAVYAKTLLLECSESRLRKLSEEGSRRASRLLQICDQKEEFESAANTFSVLLDLLMAAAGEALAILVFTPAFEKAGMKPLGALILSSLIVWIVLFLLILVFGKVLPKRRAAKNTDKVILKKTRFIRFYAAFLKPLGCLYNGVVRVFKKIIVTDVSYADEQNATEEEILMMVDEGEEKGVIEETAKDMIENIFDFHDTTVDEIMTHRIDVVAIEDDAPIEEAAKLAIENGCSRIPVFHEDIDHIVGILYVKDLLRYIGKKIEADLKITDLMRKPYFIPESKRCAELFAEMTEKHIQFAVILDEYGGTEGIITLEDLLESIVGNIQDEYDDEEEEIQKIDENVFTVDGSVSIDEISDMLHVPFPEEGEYDTIAGFIVDQLGRIPTEDEHPSVEYGSLILTVEETEDRRISRVRIERKEMPEEENEDDE